MTDPAAATQRPPPLQRLKYALRGASYFALVGPPVGCLLTFIVLAFTGQISGGDIGMMLLVGALFFVHAYSIGLLPAFVTGLIACACYPRAASLAGFLGFCALGALVAGLGLGLLQQLVGASMGMSRAMNMLLYFLWGLVPALVTGWLWWRRQQRHQAASAIGVPAPESEPASIP
jgi:fructose-specific phosphotransferase system IIC component